MNKASRPRVGVPVRAIQLPARPRVGWIFRLAFRSPVPNHNRRAHAAELPPVTGRSTVGVRCWAPVLSLSAMLAGCAGGSDTSVPFQAVVEVCGRLAPQEKRACYEGSLLDELDRVGIAGALDMLAAMAVDDPSVAAEGHVYTHAIGIEAYSVERYFADLFSQCTTLFQSGCYHGVVQAHFIASGAADPERIVALCSPYEGDPADLWILFQCVHGLGHGLTMYHDHSLPKALEGCDFLTNDWNRQSCYGGAFMENVVNATDPHHPASDLVPGEWEDGRLEEGSRAHGHAALRMSDGVEPWEPLRADDPHYPCSILDDRYLTSCYLMQTSAMLWHNGGDIAHAAASCVEAPQGWRDDCFESLGRDISGRTVMDPDDALRECRRSPEEYRPWCYTGVVKNFVAVTATTEAGFSFCRRVESWAKRACYEAMGASLIPLYPDLARRREACATSESGEFEGTCLRSARAVTQ